MPCQWRKGFSEAASSIALTLARINSESVQLLLFLAQIIYSNISYVAAPYLIVMLLILIPDIPIEIVYWFLRNLYRFRYYLRLMPSRFIRFLSRILGIRIPYDVLLNLIMYGGLAVLASIGFCHIFNMYRLYFLRTDSAALHSRICYFTSIIFEMIFLSFSPFLPYGHIMHRRNWFSLGTVPGLILMRYPDLWNRTYIIHAVMSYASLTRQYWNMLIPFGGIARLIGDANLMPFLIFRPNADIPAPARMGGNEHPENPEVEGPRER